MMTLFRQVIMIIPSAFILIALFGVNYIWFAYAIAETVTSLVFVPIGIYIINKQFKLKTYQFQVLKELA